ncbi:MAG: phage tail tape measure protein [Candidatus Brocadia sp. AMX2]|uniref:Phage tail tape measure protein n=1 Tax=Candidatus Brocadia sinica JPN1 TaxID=1197129 RepID=A0ABQ0K1R2_9BACT|nr:MULTISPECIES: phage tail tape measure protein [Brocadia]MBC6932551.1 phage tail tape measure protein [Candidatus Brocadia sp.]MBL1168085.1 phage tail tape measure protein [Candidatus Brocadia sp. AMX1]NOG42667.1 phage tail tape measure protein [Planctomycetota bacterium]GIK11896.1 MAG: hypothetical protein BroJett002_06030 [Candidatus Brocadia sinica]KAA0243983.1 MAG: phage tail tape measure protein [Candidatus Brocadia sp. AMX2]
MAKQNEVKLIITTDNKDAITGIQNVGESFKKLELETGSLVSRIKSHWLGFAGAIYSAKKFIDFFIFDTANAAEELKRLSFQTSVGTDMLQAFKQVALTSGVHLNELSLSLFQFSQRLADATNGVGDSQDIFHALGIELYDTKGRLRDTGDLFIDTSRKFANMVDGFQKIDLAEKVFGRGSRAILPMFQELSENIDEIKNKQPIFSEDEINQAKQFNDNIAITKENFKELGYVVGNIVIPNLNEFFDVIKKGIIPENSWIKLIDPWGLMNRIGKSPLATSWEWFKKLVDLAEEYTDKLAGIKTEVMNLQSIRLQPNPVFGAFGLPGELTQGITKARKTEPAIIFNEKQWLKDQAEFEKSVGEAFREEGRLAAEAMKLEEEAAKRKQEVYADMFEALKFDSARYYDYRRDLLEKQRNEEIAITGDVMLDWEAFYARLRELDEERILRTNDFVGGIKVFYSELEREGFTWAKGAKGMMEDFASGGASALSKFEHSIETDTKNIGKHLKDFIGDFSDAFIDAVNRMTAEWLMSQMFTGIGSAFGIGGARSMGIGGTAGTTQAGGWFTPPPIGNMSAQGAGSAGGQVIVQQSISMNMSFVDGQDGERFLQKHSPVIQKIVGDSVDRSRAFAAQLRGNR